MENEVQPSLGSSIIKAARLRSNELVSALAVGTRFGSVFSRAEDAQLFENLAAGAGVYVQELPPWLRQVNFSRTTLMHGENMRQITGVTAMQSIRPGSLEGLATFVALCCQWTQTPHVTARRLIRDLITGELGAIVHPGSLRKPPGAIAAKLEFLIEKFVRATIVSDAMSPQSMKVRNLLVELSDKAGRVSFEPIRSDRLLALDKRMLTSLLGHNPEITSKSATTSRTQKEHTLGYPRHKDSRVHDTVSISSASIALAAAANDADVYVECHTEEGVFYLPKRPSSGLEDSSIPLFLVRLWLCQPPSSVSNMIEVSDDLDVESPRFEQQQERESTTMSYPTIFGGQAELSKAVADILGFQGQYALASREEAISTLWRWAFDYGAKLHLRRSTEHWQADLYLEPSPSATGLDDNIIPLAQLLAKSKGRREQWARKTASQEKLLRAAAIEIHRLYGIENYEKECLIPELLATSALVKFAMTVGALHHITHSDGAEMFAYAINSEWLQDGNLMLWDLLAKATGNGIGTMCLILAASALWTGTTADAAYPMSQRNRVRVGPNSIYETAADRTVLGKVGPHGVVILEIIRNPVEFSFHGLSKPIIFFSRGSVPLLGLDTRDGYIITSERRILRKTHGVKLQSKMAQDSDLDAVRYPDPVITVEPDTSDDLKSTIICAWYGGDLAFEIDPLVALLNVSKLATNLGKPLLPKMRIFKEEMRDFREPEDVGRGNMELGAPQNEVYAREPKRFPPQSLTPLDFLKKRAVIIKEGSAVFKTYSSSWLLCAAGLVPPHSVSVTRERLNYQDVLLDEGQVIIEFIPRKE
jgi:hypothetical protein